MVEVVGGEGVKDVDFDAAGEVVVLVFVRAGGGREGGLEGRREGLRWEEGG